MEIDKELDPQIIEAFNKKREWVSSFQLKQILDNYRNLHSDVETIYERLVDSGVIVDDPYKNEKAILEVHSISSEEFDQRNRSIQLGNRMAEYERILNFIVESVPFDLKTLSMPMIKKLLAFNSGFNWNDISETSKITNNRGLAIAILRINEEDTLTKHILKNTMESAGRILSEINKDLNDLGNFQREAYKITIRKDFLDSPGFPEEGFESQGSMIRTVANLHKESNSNQPIYNELIAELSEEIFHPDKQALTEKLLKKFDIPLEKKVEKTVKAEKIDTKQIILGAARTIGSSSTHLVKLIEKLEENSVLYERTKLNAFQKFIKALKKAFGFTEKSISYKITVRDPLDQTKHFTNIDFLEFMNILRKKSKIFASFSSKEGQGYAKLLGKSEESILEYVGNSITDMQKTLQILYGFDEFFKEAVPSQHRDEVKGIQIELVGIKNSIAKAAQIKSDYSAMIEENKLMEKLGINDEE